MILLDSAVILLDAAGFCCDLDSVVILLDSVASVVILLYSAGFCSDSAGCCWIL